MSTESYYKRNKKTQSKHTYGYKEKDANFLTELVTHWWRVPPRIPPQSGARPGQLLWQQSRGR